MGREQRETAGWLKAVIDLQDRAGRPRHRLQDFSKELRESAGPPGTLPWLGSRRVLVVVLCP